MTVRPRARPVVLLVLGLVAGGCSSGPTDVTRELEDIVEAVGVDEDDVGYGKTITGRQSEIGCEGVDDRDRTSRLRTATVGRTGLTPDQVVDRLVAHYEGGTGEMRLFEARPDSAVAYIFRMLDLERHRSVSVMIDDDAGFTAQVAATACSMDEFGDRPDGPFAEVPLPR